MNELLFEGHLSSRVLGGSELLKVIKRSRSCAYVSLSKEDDGTPCTALFKMGVLIGDKEHQSRCIFFKYFGACLIPSVPMKLPTLAIIMLDEMILIVK